MRAKRLQEDLSEAKIIGSEKINTSEVGIETSMGSLNLFVAATGMNVGKTSFILGLIHSLQEKGLKVGYIKPVAQRYVEMDGKKLSDDALLIKRVFQLPFASETLSPCVIEAGFTARYIQGQLKSFLPKILKAYKKLKATSDIVIIEGAGHAGVGAVIDLSNADVASLLRAPVLLLAEAGIGNTIDRVILNRALFEAKRCRVIGVVVNKIKQEKYEKVTSLLDKALLNRNIRIFGYLPYKATLSSLTLSSIKEELEARVINNRGKFDARIDENMVATMEPDEMIDMASRTNGKVLIITSADRSDILLACTTLYYSGAKNLAGILLSGGSISTPMKEVLHKVELPVIASDESIYVISSRLHNMGVKISSQDKDKIDTLFKLVPQHIMVDKLLDSIVSCKMEPQWIDKISLFFMRLLKSIKTFFLKR